MSERALLPQPITLEEAARFDPDLQAGEIVQGVFIPVSRTTWRHGVIVLNAGLLLKEYARQNPGWSVAVGDPGTKLQQTPAVLRGPDAAMLRAERQPTGRGVAGWVDGAPEVAVEVLSEGQTASEAIEKALEYLAAGTRVVWLLDPLPGRLLEVTPPNCIRILQSGDTVEGGEALPGFTARVAEFFAE